MAHRSRPLMSTGMGPPIWGRIDARLALELCREYGGGREDYEKVLEVEEIVWPTLNAQKKG